MARYEIRKQGWIKANNGTVVGPMFTVRLEGTRDAPAWIGFECDEWRLEELEDKLPKEQRELWVGRLRGAVWRYALEVLEKALASDAIDVMQGQQIRQLTPDELDSILARVREKRCSYQIRDRRELICTATRGQGSQIVSKPICHVCSIPDDDYLCSALTGALASITHTLGAAHVGFQAFCDAGREEVGTPGGCRPEGHACWHRIVESESMQLGRGLDPRGIAEALDFLNATWRLAFGKKPLLRLRSAEDVAALVQPCISRPEFKSAVSALDDVLKQMLIDDELLSDADRAKEENKGDKTLNRLTACLSSRLPRGSEGDALDAIKVLRRVNKVRQALQHSGAAPELLPALGALGVKEPIDWSAAWDQVRRAMIAALGTLRRSIEPLT